MCEKHGNDYMTNCRKYEGAECCLCCSDKECEDRINKRGVLNMIKAGYELKATYTVAPTVTGSDHNTIDIYLQNKEDKKDYQPIAKVWCLDWQLKNGQTNIARMFRQVRNSAWEKLETVGVDIIEKALVDMLVGMMKQGEDWQKVWHLESYEDTMEYLWTATEGMDIDWREYIMMELTKFLADEVGLPVEDMLEFMLIEKLVEDVLGMDIDELLAETETNSVPQFAVIAGGVH